MDGELGVRMDQGKTTFEFEPLTQDPSASIYWRPQAVRRILGQGGESASE